jgi:RNA-binding protein 26
MMLFPEEDAPLLKTWIVKRIEDTSDADSEVLAEYIIALLKHEGSKEEVRQLCEAEIPDFLTEDPAKFLDDVFRAIAYKSYVPGAAPPPPTRELALGLAHQGGSSGRPDKGNATAPVSRKRGYRDVDAPREQQDFPQNPRPTKNPRRNGPELGEQQGAAQGEFQPMDVPPFDPENPMAALMQMNMNMQMMQENWPQFSQMAQGGVRGGRKKNRRCRDFDTKGYCSRGASCKYEHGYGGGFMPPVGDAGGGKMVPDYFTMRCVA